MAKSAPLPKVGPKLDELNTAVFSSTNCIFCFNVTENKKDYFLISVCIVLFVDFQGIGVNPPITLLNYVLTKTIVLVSPSQY
jgi:hypothetical protein